MAVQRQGVLATYTPCSWCNDGLGNRREPSFLTHWDPVLMPCPSVCLLLCVSTPWDSTAGSIPAFLFPASSGELGLSETLPVIYSQVSSMPLHCSLYDRKPLPQAPWPSAFRVASCGGRGW